MKAATFSTFRCKLPKATISIHAAREGGDSPAASMVLIRAVFQSTPPVKVATKYSVAIAFGGAISIHAAREGGDALSERA